MKLAWVSDTHLDYVTDDNLITFAESLIVDNPSGIILTGDISNAKKLTYHLSAIEKIVDRPIYFVLGNHDFYGSGIETTRKNMRDTVAMSQFLRYMSITPYITLSPTSVILGHDCWYDALNGDPHDGRMVLNDWIYIQEYLGKNQDEIIAYSRKLAVEGAVHIMNGIKKALAIKTIKNVIVLSHVPPFKETHVYNGKISDDYAQPWFTSKLLGDMLLDAARSYPNINFTVLAGHTHGKVEVSRLHNLHVKVAGAKYGSPRLADLIQVDV
jgi:predicted MPP superfamily phosphohydrolase